MIVIIDYGMGNVQSVANALEKIECDYTLSCDETTIMNADALILPGVGAFDECMQQLASLDLVRILNNFKDTHKPILGICLGMQILFENGFETTPCKGLGFLKGDVVKMTPLPNLKIPHIGWNKIEIQNKDALIHEDCFMYFVHSYYVTNYNPSQIITLSEYGPYQIPGYVHDENIYGCQFHPEKSGQDGIALLKNFKEIVYGNMASN